MRTREQCLDKATYCERLARDCGSTSSALLLLEAARHWRNLARGLPAAATGGADDTVPVPALDDPLLAKMLSEVGVLIR
ncbi:MAG: hypothetical protein K2X72_09210 [Reyranella sp.]|nr:hypothetical protein [Reyranella sp.]